MTAHEQSPFHALGTGPITAAPSPVAAPMTRRRMRELAEQEKHRPSASRGASHPPRRARRLGKAAFSIGAMMFAGALAVGMTLPAPALYNEDAAAASFAASLGAQKVPTQAFAASGEVELAAPARDTYTATTRVERLAEQYSDVPSYAFSASAGSIRWPFPYTVPITSGFGPRFLCAGCSTQHNGIDFTPGSGTPIQAVAEGLVVKSIEDNSGWGNHVVVAHNINGQRVESLYAHMISGSATVQPGDTVGVGQVLGLVGNTGQSYGAHLHLEIHLDGTPIDPYAWLTANAS